MDIHVLSFGVAFLAMLVLWGFYYLFVRNPTYGTGGLLGVGQLVEGADGYPSTSKFQFWLWTIVVLFAWIAIYVARTHQGDWQPDLNLPQNLLIAMGLSVTTAVTAKGITVAYVKSNPVAKPKQDPKTTSAAAIFQDDSGFPDLSKIQRRSGLGAAVIP